MSDYLHIITVQGSRSGLGIRIVGPSSPDTPYGVFIKSVTEGSLADRDGQLQTGDKLLQVGKEELTSRTQRQAIDLLKLEAQTDSMTFTIDRSQEVSTYSETCFSHQILLTNAFVYILKCIECINFCVYYTSKCLYYSIISGGGRVQLSHGACSERDELHLHI